VNKFVGALSVQTTVQYALSPKLGNFCLSLPGGLGFYVSGLTCLMYLHPKTEVLICLCNSGAHPMPIRFTEWSQKLRCWNDNNNDDDDDDNDDHAIRHTITTMIMPLWHHYRCCSMSNVELQRLFGTGNCSTIMVKLSKTPPSAGSYYQQLDQKCLPACTIIRTAKITLPHHFALLLNIYYPSRCIYPSLRWRPKQSLLSLPAW
jgi:hypothetical protein